MARLWSRKRKRPSGARARRRRAGGDRCASTATTTPGGRRRRSSEAWQPRSAPRGRCRARERDILAEHFGDDWRTSFGFTPTSDDELETRPWRADRAIDEPDPYEVLEVEPTATWDEIVAAHRHQARVHHPDRLFGQSRRGEGGGRGAHPHHQRGLPGAPGPPRHVATLRVHEQHLVWRRGGPPASGPGGPRRRPPGPRPRPRCRPAWPATRPGGPGPRPRAACWPATLRLQRDRDVGRADQLGEPGRGRRRGQGLSASGYGQHRRRGETERQRGLGAELLGPEPQPADHGQRPVHLDHRGQRLAEARGARRRPRGWRRSRRAPPGRWPATSTSRPAGRRRSRPAAGRAARIASAGPRSVGLALPVRPSCVSAASTASRSTRSFIGSPLWPFTQRNVDVAARRGRAR